MNTIERPEYISWLDRWRDKKIIKTISGVRRCGKSTILEMYRKKLLEDDVTPKQMIAINFEDLAFEDLQDYMKLYDYVQSKLVPDKMNYIFLDEIQMCGNFEKAVDSLFLKDNCDLYITGSNSRFMSGKLATLLSGRYVMMEMLPLSFKEYATELKGRHPDMTPTQMFTNYCRYGSFPFILNFDGDAKDATEYVRALYDTIILNDVVKRGGIADVPILESIVRFLLYNVGNRTSTAKIADALKSAGKNIDRKTVDKYVGDLVGAMLFYEAPRYNIKGRQFLTTQSKFYAVDMGFRSILASSKESDKGQVLENVIYLELRRRGYDVFVGEDAGTEVDFVAMDNGVPSYYQVCLTALESETLKREMEPLKRIKDNFPKYLLTLDEAFANENIEGIIKTNALDWLMGV